MDQKYKQLVNDLKSIESDFRGYVDQPQHPAMVRFASDIRRTIGDASAKKNPRSIEGQVKQLVSQIDSIGESDELMDYRHQSSLIRSLERARDSLRKFDD